MQNVKGHFYRALADSLSTSYRTIAAERGNIYSSDGHLLATSLPFFEIRMDGACDAFTDDYFYANVNVLSEGLAAIFKDKTAKTYEQILIKGRKSGDRYILLQRKVSYNQLKELRNLPIFNLGRYRGGMIAVQENRRVYPFENMALRTIGYVRENAKSVGLEGRLDSLLDGEDGRQLMQKIAGNTWMPVSDDNAVEPQNGDDIVTTINVGLQDVAQKALLNTLNENLAEHGTVILMEVSTGKIRALANLTRTPSGQYTEMYNYAIGEAIEPGSTFKMASCAALLEAGLADTNTIIDVEGGTKTYGRQKIDDGDHRGKLINPTLQEVFAASSNVGISKIVNQQFASHPQDYINFLDKVGLRKKTGIDLDGEAKPYIKDTRDKYWNKVVSLPWMSIGYEESVTPLQTLCWYNTVANNGTRVKPQLVEKISLADGQVKNVEPEVAAEHVISQSTVNKLKGMMQEVTRTGTAAGKFKDCGYTVAGKTGTAQIFQQGNGFQNNGGSTKYLASFVGYFPAKNPKYSCIVVVYNPSKRGTYYGSQVACPVFRELADKVYATSLDLHVANNDQDKTKKLLMPLRISSTGYDISTVFSQLHYPMSVEKSGTWIQYDIDSALHPVNKVNTIVPNAVPNVLGMTLKDAIYLLENAGIKVNAKGGGKVIAQSSAPGSPIQKGTTISIVLN